MIKTKIENRKTEVTKDILCNRCGNSCKGVEPESFEFAKLIVHWGYGSTKHDGEVHEAHLCESCWEEIVKGFKHSDLVAENQY